MDINWHKGRTEGLHNVCVNNKYSRYYEQYGYKEAGVLGLCPNICYHNVPQLPCIPCILAKHAAKTDETGSKVTHFFMPDGLIQEVKVRMVLPVELVMSNIPPNDPNRSAILEEFESKREKKQNVSKKSKEKIKLQKKEVRKNVSIETLVGASTEEKADAIAKAEELMKSVGPWDMVYVAKGSPNEMVQNGWNSRTAAFETLDRSEHINSVIIYNKLLVKNGDGTTRPLKWEDVGEYDNPVMRGRIVKVSITCLDTLLSHLLMMYLYFTVHESYIR